MNLTLKVWRQESPETPGRFETYEAKDIIADMSFLEMLDVVNEGLLERGEAPIDFDSDCREGICGMCSLTINCLPHGGHEGTTTCQLHMRSFSDGETITIEPFRATAFPVQRDLVIDRSSMDEIIRAGGYVDVRTGGAPDANMIPVAKSRADRAMDAAACIGCGACVAACKNASAMLFTSAKVTHLNSLPQGEPEKGRRAVAMVQAMDEAGFGACTVTGACHAVCPKEIPLEFISQLNRDYLSAVVAGVTVD